MQIDDLGKLPHISVETIYRQTPFRKNILGDRMKCYECAKNGKESDVLGICIVCGRGVCKDHLMREKIPKWDGEYDIKLSCMGDSCKLKDMQPMLKIVCTPCHDALIGNQ